MTFCSAHGIRVELCRNCHPSPQLKSAEAPKPVGRQMNKTEARYAALLEGLRLAGEIVSYQYEAIKLVLGYDPKTGRLVTLKPDFLVIRKHNTELCDCNDLELHEVKGGFEREDAKLKRIWAAQKFPYFHFKLCRYEKGQWNIREIK